MSYLKWNEKIISDFSDESISRMYNDGYLFGRTGHGEMYQTRSIRIDVSMFELNSENRRVLRKTEDVKLVVKPLPYADYSWEVGKVAKDFYDTKFGKGTFSANKVKELLTDAEKSNFNRLFQYVIPTEVERSRDLSTPLHSAQDDVVGHAICYENGDMLHYSYPFYALDTENKNLGMGMMLKAIAYAKECGKTYVYLGSFSRPTDTYKLQFTGLEWFDGKTWQEDLIRLKETL